MFARFIYRPVTPGVAGSSPVRSAKEFSKALSAIADGAFVFSCPDFLRSELV